MWAGYRRVSRVGDRAETLISPDLQAARIEAYAAARGIEVELLAPELDVSGATTQRPVLSEAIRGIEDGRYEGIIVAQLDRLSRMSIIEALGTIRRVEQAGGQVVAVAENFDATTPEGRMARNVILSMAEMQLDRYKGQFRAAKQQAVERGIWPTNTVPVGYRRRADRTLEPDPKTRKTVVRIFELRAAGHSWSQIASQVSMGQTRVAKIARNRVYLGELRVGEWINTRAHEPIVDRDLFAAAQLGHPRPARNGSGGGRALLSGIAKCAGCGGAMTVFSKDGWRGYRCSRQVFAGGRRCQARAIISTAKLDGYISSIVPSLLTGIRLTGSERTDQLEQARRELQQHEDELAAYQQAQSASGLGPELFLAGMRPRVEAVKESQRHVAQLRARPGPVPAGSDAAALWREWSTTEQNHALRSLLSHVIVSRGRGPCAERVRVFVNTLDGPVELGVAGPHDGE